MILSPIFDLEPPLEGEYLFEVSSPGIERKLTKPEHYSASLGEKVKIKLKTKEKFIQASVINDTGLKDMVAQIAEKAQVKIVSTGAPEVIEENEEYLVFGSFLVVEKFLTLIGYDANS